MTENLSQKRVALTLAIISGMLYIVCAVLFAVAPELTLKFFSKIFHGIDITRIASTTIPLSSTLIGFAEIVVFSLIVGWLFAVIYNKIK